MVGTTRNRRVFSGSGTAPVGESVELSTSVGILRRGEGTADRDGRDGDPGIAGDDVPRRSARATQRPGSYFG